MLLRPARPGDVRAIAALFRRSFSSIGFLPTLHTPEEDRAFFAAAVRDDEVWIAEDRGRLVGFASIRGETLTHLYVDPGDQGWGIGSALFVRAVERRPSGLRLWTFQRNESARRFYERHGCRAIECTDGSGNEAREPDVLYEWRPQTGTRHSESESAHLRAESSGTVDYEGKG